MKNILFLSIIVFLSIFNSSIAGNSIDNSNHASAIPNINISNLTLTIKKPIFSKNRREKIEEKIIIKPIQEIKIQENHVPDFELSGIIINKSMRIAIIHDKKKQEYSLKKENAEQDGWIIYKINKNNIYLKNDTTNFILKLSDK